MEQEVPLSGFSNGCRLGKTNYGVKSVVMISCKGVIVSGVFCGKKIVISKIGY